MRDYVEDLKFFIALVDSSSFSINDKSFEFTQETSFSYNPQTKRDIEQYEKIIMALDILHVSNEIKLDELQDKDWRNLYTLVTAFVDNQPVRGLAVDSPLLGNIWIGNTRLLLVCSKHGDEEGVYQLRDFFKEKLFVTATETTTTYDEGGNEMRYHISPCSYLKSQDFLTISNLDVDNTTYCHLFRR